MKPLLFAAHQGVVPVLNTTIDKRQHPPFSRYFDGDNIWGRGSCDDKSGLIGIMSAIEVMLEGDFKPTRTVVIASGFDKEVDGVRGASSLATTMLERFGENAFTMPVDEGCELLVGEPTNTMNNEDLLTAGIVRYTTVSSRCLPLARKVP
ncbi:Zn-dependent exopeptidase [Rhizopogon vinicolor AM-OR11-026]|uniref:Zn-dependent exopeptidase n=1 Tax=Rhizopogon vinicolor AM-OR11-026 TaxID=1314800 RepID=A0A1B7NGK8_9AGAM|nr:Zn-dependent exopeptidase [Rhizopogon vinicolor AM-OR11-026]